MSHDADIPYAGRFDGPRHLLPVRVYYEDTDFSGVVYHANYLRWLERGRSDFLRLAGPSHQQLMQRAEPLAWTIRRIGLEFIQPARVDDALLVETRYTQCRGARLNASQAITRGGEVLLRAEIEAACIDFEGRPKRIPADLAQLLQERIDA